jgi:predicted enzyme related to lactoylglutathione lyase
LPIRRRTLARRHPLRFTYEEVGNGSSYSMVKRAGDRRVVAGLGELDATTPAEIPPGWLTYFMVGDCDASAAKGAELGAIIVVEPFGTAAGRMAALIGAQGEAFSLIQARSEE